MVSDFHLVPFKPSQLGMVLMPKGTNDSAHLTLAEALAKAPGAVAMIDGPMWATHCSKLCGLHFDKATGIDQTGNWPSTYGCTLAVVNGRAVMLEGKQRPVNATFAVQLYPELVRDGKDAHRDAADPDRVWRAAAGILKDGRVFFAVGVGSMEDFTQRLLKEGAVEAGYTDGGGSTKLYVGGQVYGHRENRAVATWLYARPEGPNKVVAALGLIGLAGAVGFAYLAAKGKIKV